MKDVETMIEVTRVVKTATNEAGKERLRHERDAYDHLAGSQSIAKVLSASEDSLVLERIDGENTKQWLDFQEDWTCKARPWADVKEKMGKYVAAEMDFLSRDMMYRDLNLEHLIFTKDKAILVDVEEAVRREGTENWQFDSRRGTWETMAPEEFPGSGELTERTATYRVAVVAYLALTGKLPFPRMPQRHDVYTWRKTHDPYMHSTLQKPVRKVFAAALARQKTRRYKDPETFLRRLEQAYDS